MIKFYKHNKITLGLFILIFSSYIFSFSVDAAHSGGSGSENLFYMTAENENSRFHVYAIYEKIFNGDVLPYNYISYYFDTDIEDAKFYYYLADESETYYGDIVIKSQPIYIFGISDSLSSNYIEIPVYADFRTTSYTNDNMPDKVTDSPKVSKGKLKLYNSEYIKTVVRNPVDNNNNLGLSERYLGDFVNADNLYRFKNVSDAYNWILTRNPSLVTPPNTDPSFTQPDYNDPYDESIPAPTLSGITYDGFTIDNPNNFDFDVIIDYTLYGSKIAYYTSNMPAEKYYYCTGDQSSIFLKRTLDFRTSSISPNISGRFGIKEFYNYDILQLFRDDWTRWNQAYPDYKSLPGYRSIVHSLNPPDEGKSRSQWYGAFMETELPAYQSSQALPSTCTNFEYWLRNSRKWSISYTVRFYDISKNNYSQWVRYTLNPSGSSSTTYDPGTSDGINGNINYNPIIGGDENGNPILGPGAELEYDPGSGSYIDASDLPNSDFNIDMESVISIFTNLNGLIGQCPALFSNLFSFIPVWLQLIIFGSISIVCLLSIYHFIRG